MSDAHRDAQGATQRLMIFAKAPMPGRVKTRLKLPPETAAAVHAAFVRDVVERHQRPGRQVTLWRAGDLEHPLWAALVAAHGVALGVQPAGDLGDRMAAAFAETGKAGDPVVILGTDSPTLPPRLVDRAFAALAERDAVIGPACDGGYVLLGLRGAATRDRSIFPAGLAWGTEAVLPTTLDALAARGDFAVLDPWYDVDRPEDLRWMRHHLPLLDGPAPRHTIAMLAALDGRRGEGR